MLVELYIFFELITIVSFAASFMFAKFSGTPILWAITLILSGLLMYTSFSVEGYVYQWQTNITAYQPVIVSNSYPYLMGINLIFFALSLVFGIYDLVTKIKGLEEEESS